MVSAAYLLMNMMELEFFVEYLVVGQQPVVGDLTYKMGNGNDFLYNKSHSSKCLGGEKQNCTNLVTF